MDKFWSCDWGTSSFRLRLVEVTDLRVMAEKTSGQGIAETHAGWQATGGESQEQRMAFFLGYIKQKIDELGQEHPSLSLDQVPLLISGMGSSSIGIRELPYQALPFAIDGSDAPVQYFEPGGGTPAILLISGLKSANDVMRGEETQLVGVAAEEADDPDDKIFIFPGTHSKHILVRGRRLTSFTTYMTGEFFSLLSTHSILRESVEKGLDLADSAALQSFSEGVRASIGANLLHTAFGVRTNTLFRKRPKNENYAFLSGLLIGAELQDLNLAAMEKLYLCASANLIAPYRAALEELGLLEKTLVYPAKWVDEAVVRGQYRIYSQFKAKP